MRRGRLIRKVCARCGEVEFDERHETGQWLELEECADGKWRCPKCAEVWDDAHRCFICEDVDEDTVTIEGETVCASCARAIREGNQDSPAEIKAEQLADARGIFW